MLRIKTIILFTILSLLFVGCTSQQELEMEQARKAKKIDFLLETKDINNIKRLEVSNNLIQVLPVINISGVQLLLDKNSSDKKPILFRNEKCIFQGIANADPTTNRVAVKLEKATCRTTLEHKVNYAINGWALGDDEVYGLKAKKRIYVKQLDDDNFIETTILNVKQGDFAYLSIDMVKQIETILVKDTMTDMINESKKTDLVEKPKQKETNKIIRIQ